MLDIPHLPHRIIGYKIQKTTVTRSIKCRCNIQSYKVLNCFYLWTSLLTIGVISFKEVKYRAQIIQIISKCWITTTTKIRPSLIETIRTETYNSFHKFIKSSDKHYKHMKNITQTHNCILVLFQNQNKGFSVRVRTLECKILLFWNRRFQNENGTREWQREKERVRTKINKFRTLDFRVRTKFGFQNTNQIVFCWNPRFQNQNGTTHTERERESTNQKNQYAEP